MIVTVNIEVQSDRFGESQVDVDVTERFHLSYRQNNNETHGDRENLVHRIEEMLMFAGIKNSGRHG